MADTPQVETELDDLTRFENEETAHTVPLGWWLLFWGLVVWGAWYLWSFTPSLGGWSQALDAEADGASMGTNLLATVAFTAIPTAAAAGLWLLNKKKKG